MKSLLVTFAAMWLAIGVGGCSATPSSTAGGRPDITRLDKSMLISCSEFPAIGDPDCQPQVASVPGGRPPNPMDVAPADCALFFNGWAANQQQVAAEHVNGPNAASVTISLAIGPNHPDVSGIAAKCQHGTVNSNSRPLGFTTTRVSVESLPPWALALEVQADDQSSYTAEIMGVDRGVYVRAEYYEAQAKSVNSATNKQLVTMFNDQAARLDAA